MKVEKIICDCCKEEIPVKEFYYGLKADITYGNYEVESVKCRKGDYCEQCFKSKFFKED